MGVDVYPCRYCDETTHSDNIMYVLLRQPINEDDYYKLEKDSIRVCEWCCEELVEKGNVSSVKNDFIGECYVLMKPTEFSVRSKKTIKPHTNDFGL